MDNQRFFYFFGEINELYKLFFLLFLPLRFLHPVEIKSHFTHSRNKTFVFLYKIKKNILVILSKFFYVFRMQSHGTKNKIFIFLYQIKCQLKILWMSSASYDSLQFFFAFLDYLV